MGIRDNDGEKGLRGGSVHNEFEKVTEKSCFGRHLPDGYPGLCRREWPPRQVRYNEFEKVTEKGCFGRHLPDGAGRMGPDGD